MNLKEWLTYNPYKKIWCFVGRPFSYIIRDIWHEVEWLMQTFWFFIGITSAIFLVEELNHPCVWKTLGIVWGIYTFGYLNGHLFWGKKYIEGQKGK